VAFLETFAGRINKVADEVTCMLHANGKLWFEDSWVQKASSYENGTIIPLFKEMVAYNWTDSEETIEFARKYILPDAEAIVCKEFGKYNTLRLETSRSTPLDGSENTIIIPSLTQLYKEIQAMRDIYMK
jgi:hypothetical protein